MNNSVFVIAEAGVNHNGQTELAKKLVHEAAKTGADAIKFQTFRADKTVLANTEKATYQKKTSSATESQHEMLSNLELSAEDFFEIRKECVQCGIEFMSTAFDPESLRFLVDDLNIKRIKIPSGEITNPLLLLEAAKSNLPLIVSTGMATLDDLRSAIAILQTGSDVSALDDKTLSPAATGSSEELLSMSKNEIAILHCRTSYPTPAEQYGLNFLTRLRDEFKCPIGLSDHSLGIHVSVAAVAMGATIIEKHITLDRALPGPDHQASLEVSEFSQMVSNIRDISQALSGYDKELLPEEVLNRKFARRGLYAAGPIGKGQLFTEDDFLILRPENGTSPLRVLDLVGKISTRSYQTFDDINE